MSHPKGPVSPHHLPNNHVDQDLIEAAEEIGQGYGSLVTPEGEIDNRVYSRPVNETPEVETEPEPPETEFFLPTNKLMEDVEGYFKRYYELIDQVNLTLTRYKSQNYSEDSAMNNPDIKSALTEIEKIRRSFYGSQGPLKERGLDDTFEKVKNLRPLKYSDI